MATTIIYNSGVLDDEIESHNIHNIMYSDNDDQSNLT